jgi:Holliday junction resolvase
MQAQKIEQIKTLTAYSKTNFHGNTKKVGLLTVEEIKTIVSKKYNRKMGNYIAKNGRLIMSYEFKSVNKLPSEKVRSLLEWSKQCIGTSYFKIMIEGNTGIYLASPVYGHADYNKCRLFDKTPQTLKLMQLFNNYFKKLEPCK